MSDKKDRFNEIYEKMLDEVAPGTAGNPTQQMASTTTQQPGQPVQGQQQQQQQQPQIDYNAAATAVVSAVTSKAQNYDDASKIMSTAMAILQKKFNVKAPVQQQQAPVK